MSRDRNKEGIVIDVTPERGDSRPEDSLQRPTPHQAGSKLAAALAMIALLLVVGALALGYRYWLNIKAEMSALDERLVILIAAQDELTSGIEVANKLALSQQQIVAEQDSAIALHGSYIEQQKAAFTRQASRLAEERLLMEEREAELRSVVASVYQRIGSSGNQWMVAEAEYLMRLAGHRLQLTRDVITAQAALELADQRLKETANPGWNTVRDQLALEITALANIELPDKTAVANTLAQLAKGVPKLALNESTGRKDAKPETGARPDKPEERTWETLASDLWSGLKDSVKIHRSDTPMRALLTPEQQSFLYQNLQLQLETARLALAQGEAGLFRQSLEKAADWLERFFDLQQSHTQSMQQSIRDLAALDLAPALPDISGSLRIMETRKALASGLPNTREETQKP